MINDIDYWKERHLRLKGKLGSVGNKSYSDEANFYIYKMLKERFEFVIKTLGISPKSNFLDAGAGIGLISEFLSEKGFCVTATDVSQLALDLIKAPEVKKVCSEIKELPFQKKSFDVVFCFDVLYHILKEKDWKDSISKLCEISNEYVILHERFLKNSPKVSSKHIKIKTYSQTASVLRENGFEECLSVATHFWPLRNYFYRLTCFFPKFFYNLDRLTLKFFDDKKIKWGSHYIKVFKRIK